MSQDDSTENPYGSPACDTHNDGELLQRFTAEKDQTAFEALVCRHGPVVWSVCRGLLRHRQDTEDAFQATFLILVRDAVSIRKRKSLRSWLFGVARRVAMKALRAEYRRLQLLHRVVLERQARPGAPDPISEELQNAVENELQNMPEIQRTVIEKCVFAGESYRQVGEELKIPLATVASHLRRGRKELRARLVIRGIGTAGLAGIMAALSRAVAPPETLCRVTAENAASLLAGNQAALPVRIVSLMNGVALKMPITAKCLLAVWLSLGTGASTWWAVHDTRDHEGDSGVQVAVDAGPTLRAALVLDVDDLDAPKGSPTIEFTTDAGPTIRAALTLDVDTPGAPQSSPTIEFVAEPSVR